MEQKILDTIKDAEMILVGIGEEFSPERVDPEMGEALRNLPGEHAQEERNAAESAFRDECLKSRFYESIPDGHETIAAYNRLRELIGPKPYFVVTLNTDDLIYRSSLEQDLIVAPCGSLMKLQCGEHIVPAKKIRDAVLEASGTPAKETRNAAEDKNVPSEDKIVKELAVCPECGRPLQFHTVAHPGYMEEGYLPQWEKYTKWLQCTLHRKLCILELGVGFKYPQVVRFPFEKTAFFNQKATLVRINSKFPQLTEEMAGRGISVRENPVHFLVKH